MLKLRESENSHGASKTDYSAESHKEGPEKNFQE